MSKHTPGPWAAWSPAQTPSVNPQGAAFVVGPARIMMDRSSGFSLADADLIAAAPDLLEACEAHINALRSRIRNGNDRPEYAEAIYQAECKMLAAIAKARGET